MNIAVRQATLEDTAAISALHTARVAVWQRLDADGRVETVPYPSLSIVERWLHGADGHGPWMSAETAAIFLNHLLLGAGLPLVACDIDRAAAGEPREAVIVGYCEAYINSEPDPFGVHLHIASVLTPTLERPEGDATASPNSPALGGVALGVHVTRALLEAVFARARRLRCTNVTFNRGEHWLLAALDGIEGAPTPSPVQTVQRYSLPARTGQVFYKVTEHTDPNPLQISGWAMPLGRTTSARHHWETLWTPIWNTLGERRARRTHRLRIASGGQEAFVYVQQQLYNPRAADVAAWSARMLALPILTGLRDWAHREGYRTLSLIASAETARTFASEADAEAFTAITYAVPMVSVP